MDYISQKQRVSVHLIQKMEQQQDLWMALLKTQSASQFG